MHSQTPGEMLLGLVTEFRRKNSDRWTNEILFGLVQFWYILCSCVMGTFAFYVAMMLLMGVLFNSSSLWIAEFAGFLFWLLWPVCILHPLLLFHFTSSRSTFAVSFDHLLGLEVDFVQRGKQV